MNNDGDSSDVASSGSAGRRALGPLGWFIAFVLFPYGPFAALWWLGAISIPALIVYFLAGTFVHAAALSVVMMSPDRLFCVAWVMRTGRVWPMIRSGAET